MGNKVNWMGDYKTRFFKKISKTSSCWNWIGKKTRSGYGRLTYNKKEFYAHRLSFLIHNGRLINGLCVCHRCDNPCCVNPKHLWQGTVKQNMEDRDKKGHLVDNSGENCGMAKLTWKEVGEMRVMYRSGRFTMKELATLFRVGHTTVCYIINGKTWVK